MVFPSTKDNTETSRPVMNSSITISSPAEPNCLSIIRVLTPAFASSRSLQIRTPLPRARPSAFNTIGIFAVSRYASAFSGSLKVSYAAVGMPYFFIRSFENALEPSRIAALALGPKARRPAASKASTAPAASGSSGATTVKSISCSFAKATSLSNSITPIFTHSATSAIPALPGAQYIFSTFGLFASFHAIACSLPPPPTIKIFICVFLLTPQTDRYLAGLPLSFFLFYLFIRDQVNGLREQLPLCLLHNSALQCLRSITLLYFHCFL